jgi:hypothetical protein
LSIGGFFGFLVTMVADYRGLRPHAALFSGYGSSVDAWMRSDLWERVAADLRGHRAAGLERLMTEDTLRFTTIKALAAEGVDPAGMRVEWPHPILKGSRVDLVAGGEPPTALIEFKYPREPNDKNAAWTMALGEVMKDVYRLAACPGAADRLFVYAETSRLRGYMAASAQRYGLDLDVDDVILRPADAARLPITAAQIIGTDLASHHVTARRMAWIDVDEGLRLSVYVVASRGSVDPSHAEIAIDDLPEPAAIADLDEAIDEPVTEPSAETRNGARREILEAIRAVLARTESSTFSVIQIVDEMRKRGSGYAESTVRTMITAHMCIDAPDNAAATYDDLERPLRGVYRLAPRHRDRSLPPISDT